MNGQTEDRPLCQMPFLQGDAGFHEAWATAEGRCERRSTWRVTADVERIYGRAFRGRVRLRATVKVQGCGQHPLARPFLNGRAQVWEPTEGIVAEAFEGYALPREMRGLAAGVKRRLPVRGAA